ncbi:unnamed protein product [Rotaria socialis]|uniref:Uncharacterized protein n=1 Tax=Rotaria socialis TaxID=392032 RepID=A0A817MWE5_9BILA|nr:unnamed protein product [Rotaria socialis]CAF3422445.1 unnamed protein product [Rotaria socialis]CAF3632911.1 unnamed protein product [Rotaria socialis]CAF4434228.1 unnamed protein product [Rotaria socialis]CAF4624414.1 unnamed protein product [Rotaria socialis]
MPTIMYVFQSTTRVRKLTFTASKSLHYTVVDPHLWESILSKYFPELKWLCLRLSSHINHTSLNPDWPVDLDEDTWQLKYEKQIPTAEHNYHRAAFSII